MPQVDCIPLCIVFNHKGCDLITRISQMSVEITALITARSYVLHYAL